MNYSELKKIIVPRTSVEFAYEHMREMGENKLEGVALFVGKPDGVTFNITESIIPKQTLRRSVSGLSYTVEGDELQRLNIWLYENKLRLVAQIHSHPSEAYHSETDDEYPIVTNIGGFSIVVPNYAQDAIDIDKWAVYRLTQDRCWKEILKDEKRKLLMIK